MNEKELQDYLHNMGQKERRELTAVETGKTEAENSIQTEYFEQQRLQLEAELTARGFEGSASEIDLLLRGGSIPSGAGLRIFTATIDCRKMTNGVSDTDGKALTIHALNDLRKNVLIDG